VTESSNAAEERGYATEDDMKRQTTLHWLICGCGCRGVETANVVTKPIRSTSYRVVTLAATREICNSSSSSNSVVRRLPPHYLMLMVSSTDWLRSSCCCYCNWAGGTGWILNTDSC